jgi:CRISPR-associated protein Csm2
VNRFERTELKGQGIPPLTTENYASCAEKVMEELSKRQFNKLTTTKLRGMYSLITNVSVRVTNQEEFERATADIQYLKVRMAYEAGREKEREKPVKTFLDATHLMAYVDAIKSYEQFQLYCRYAEALVAYFKYFGGKDS